MDFKFNFSDESDNEDDCRPLKKFKKTEENTSACEIRPYKEVLSDFRLTESVRSISYDLINHTALKCVSLSVDENEKFKSLANLDQDSDLIPRVYEGGLKVWECSIDLINYFVDQDIKFESKHVLELGCGCGLPGIYALLNGASSVHFHDYNEEVLEHVTIQNILLNINGCVKSEKGSTKKTVSSDLVRCFTGDWSCFINQDIDRYDIILSSETIYCKDNYKSLHEVFSKFLKPSGKCLIAAKTFYFGVGGGTREFEMFVEGQGVFDVIASKTFTDGVHREILTLTFKNFART